MNQLIDPIRFRAARRKAGFDTQETLAKVCGVWPNTIGRIERGELRPGKRLTAKLNKLLKVDIESFLISADDILCDLDGLAGILRLRGLSQDKADLVYGMIVGLQEGVTPERSFQMALVYAKLAASRRASAKDGESGRPPRR